MDHKACIRSIDGKIVFEVICPKGSKTIVISQDATIFMEIRNKSSVEISKPPDRSYSWSNLLEITDDCNSFCAVCYASSGGRSNPVYLDVDQIVRSASLLKKNGLHCITITGGEPTLHPQLLNIIRHLSGMGLTVNMPTNGLMIGNNPDLPKEMKSNGLGCLYVQFDTLNSATHLKLRGNDDLSVKKRALVHAKKSGLRFGVIATIIRDNLDEAGLILQYAAGFAPDLFLVTFQAAAPAGRFNLPKDDLVHREDIIHSIINSGVVPGLTYKNFWPYPRFDPYLLNIHPDCGALLYLAVSGNGIEPLENILYIDKLYRLSSRSRAKPNFFLSKLLFLSYLSRSVRFTKIPRLVRMLFGFITQRGSHSLLIVAIEQFMGEYYQDKQRLAYCTTKHMSPDGELVCGCVFNHWDEKRGPFIRSKAGHQQIRSV
ncbi:MAG: radical SAM protein [Nitrospirota bacterium]